MSAIFQKNAAKNSLTQDVRHLPEKCRIDPDLFEKVYPHHYAYFHLNKHVLVFLFQNANDHCMLLALPCGRDPLDVHAQTRALKTGFITYLQVKQAAGIINIVNSATKQVGWIFSFIHSFYLQNTSPVKIYVLNDQIKAVMNEQKEPLRKIL